VKVPAPPTQEEQSELTKRKSRSEYRISEDLLNETTNIQKAPSEEKKKSLIISEKNKTFSAKDIKEKMEAKPQEEGVVGPSTHTIPEDKLPAEDVS
jgi:hypothetical protein